MGFLGGLVFKLSSFIVSTRFLERNYEGEDDGRRERERGGVETADDGRWVEDKISSDQIRRTNRQLDIPNFHLPLGYTAGLLIAFCLWQWAIPSLANQTCFDYVSLLYKQSSKNTMC